MHECEDFNWRSALHRLCKKFKKQNARHVELHSYLKLEVPCAPHVLRVKVILTDIADAAADISRPSICI